MWPIATERSHYFSHQCRIDRGVCVFCVCLGRGQWGRCVHSNASTPSVLNKSIHALSALCLQGTMVRLKESHKGTLEAFVGVSLCVCLYVDLSTYILHTERCSYWGFLLSLCVSVPLKGDDSTGWLQQLWLLFDGDAAKPLRDD